MSTPQRIGGYTYRQQIARGNVAERTARQYTEKLLDERPGPALAAMYVARIGLALGEIADVLAELERIGRGAQRVQYPQT